MKESAHTNTLDTAVSAPLGEASKDVWAKRFREGDVRAGIKLACCYEMTGELAEGLIVIAEVLRHDLPPTLKSEALLRKAVLLEDSPAAAWGVITQATLEVEPELRGKLHNQRGRILKDLKRYDSAIIEYTASAYYFEQCNATHLRGLAYNNLASVYRKAGLFDDAHTSVDVAIGLWHTYEYLPHALDQKALIHIDQQQYQEAYELAIEAVSQAGDRRRWSAEFLCTLSLAEAGTGEFEAAILRINQALEIADYLSDDNLRLTIFKTRKRSLEIMWDAANQTALRLALKLSAGNARQAAKKLEVNHSVVNKAIKKHPALKPFSTN